MIKLLIVDDEQEIREGIKYSTVWEENDIQVIGEASNGSEALEIINKTFPDIIIMDIRMPEMNGLQLLEALSNTHPYIKSIILSGYEDFDYARKGLQFGALDYLLKPCRPIELVSSILKAKSFIENENAKKEILQKYQKDYNEFLPMIKNKYLRNFITENKNDSSMPHMLNFLHFEISMKNLKVVLIRLDSYLNVSQNLNTQDTELLKSTVINISKEIMSKEYPCEIFEENDDVVLLINIEENDELPLTLISILKNSIKQNLKLTVSVGISNFCYTIIKLHTAYKQALQAVDFKFFFGEDSIINYSDIKGLYNYNKSYPLAKEKQLLNCIKAGDEKALLSKLDSFFETQKGFEANIGFIKKSSLALLFSVYHLCLENNVPGDEILEHIDSLDKLNNFSTMNHLKQYIYTIILASSRQINNNKINNKLIENIIKYINENYRENINLETVAKNVFITPPYVSILFKQVLGIHFVDYLHKIRLNKACELLRDPKLKSYEIAYMVGYNDDKYFSQIFKKHFGLTPIQYRANII